MRQGIENELKRIREEREGQTLQAQVEGSLNEAYGHIVIAGNVLAAAQKIREDEQHGYHLMLDRKNYLEDMVQKQAETIKKLEDEKNEWVPYNVELSIKNGNLGAQLDQQKQQNKYLSNENKRHVEDVANYQIEINKKDAKIRELTAEVVRLNEKVSRYKAGVEDWKKGYTDLQVSLKNTEALNRRLLSDAESDRINQLEEELGNLNTAFKEVSKKRNELLSERYQLTVKVSNLERERDSFRDSANHYADQLSKQFEKVNAMDVSVKKMDSAMARMALERTGYLIKLDLINKACDDALNFFALRTMIREIIDGS